jgi:hypothetical protein
MKDIKVKPLFYFPPEVFSSCNLLQHDISAILLEAKVSVFIPHLRDASIPPPQEMKPA